MYPTNYLSQTELENLENKAINDYANLTSDEGYEPELELEPQDDDISELLAEFGMTEKADGTLDTGIQYLDLATFQIVIHKRVLDTMNALYEKYPSLEYGLYLKGFFDPSQNIYYISADKDEDIYIPKQEVTSGSIKFIEGRPSPEFTAAIHKHPEGVTNFSGTDETSINTNFECSLLYIKSKGIFLGNINIFTDIPGVAFKFKTNKIKIYYPDSPTLNKVNKKIIARNTTKPSPKKLSTNSKSKLSGLKKPKGLLY